MMRFLLIFVFVFTQAQHSPGVMIDSFQTFDSYSDIKYDESLRPQFHYSSKKNWINDPNGMVYYKGEYHLFFQHNPKAIHWGNMTWGHAVSKDMVHWEQLQHAILPYGNGTIFSGTAAVDYPNSLGKNTDEEEAIVAYFTHAQNDRKDLFYQAGAISTDRGRTFELIDGGRPLVANQGFDRGERDPKILWHAPSKKWVLILWIKRANKKQLNDLGKVRFFGSTDLKNWKKLSDFDRKWVYECMDMVELAVDGDPNKKRWLIYDASFDYEIGTFDGQSLVTDQKNHLGDLGDAYYAAQTFNNSPDERTVIMGWLRTSDNNVYVDQKMPFNQHMSFPATMELKTTAEGIRLFRWPIKEIKGLYQKSLRYQKIEAKVVNENLKKESFDGIDLFMSFDRSKTSSFQMNIRGQMLTYEKGNFYFNDVMLPTLNLNKVNVRILLDRTTIEIFADDGFSVLSTYAVPTTENNQISVRSDKALLFDAFEVNKLKSIWP
ncbi:MAG: GH32 C-terminal domain-containing protein [Flavobacteriaceae bacterium]